MFNELKELIYSIQYTENLLRYKIRKSEGNHKR